MKKLTALDLMNLGTTGIKAAFFAPFCYVDDFEWYYFIESDCVGDNKISSISSIHKFGTHEELIEFIECDMSELYGPAINDNYKALKAEAERAKNGVKPMLIDRLPADWCQYELGSNS